MADVRSGLGGDQIILRSKPDQMDWDLSIAAGWKTLLGSLINDGARLRFFPHRIMMFLLLAHSSASEERVARLDAADDTFTEWKRIASGMTTEHAAINVPPELSNRLTTFMMDKHERYDACVSHFSNEATMLLAQMRRGEGRHDQLAHLADYVAIELLACMNELVTAFTRELDVVAQGDKDTDLTARRNVAALKSSATNAVRLANDLARINAGVRIVALNAQIEAVRTGKDGLTFGVVATEIKELSGRIADITTDIQKHLQA